MNKIKRVAIECIFRKSYRSREFTTPGNFEAFNMLMNKLDKMGVADQSGRLIFEFVPNEKSEMCKCGHNRYVHATPRAFTRYRDACQAKDCKCLEYKERSKKSK